MFHNIIILFNYFSIINNKLIEINFFLYTWPLLAPVRKIMALGRKKMALVCKIIALL